MVSALLAVPALFVADLGTADWMKVYEVHSARDWIAAVWAVDRDDVFVGGSWGVTRVKDADQRRQDTPGVAVEGFAGDDSKGIFAVGTRELVLHFTGTSWLQEHAAPSSVKRSPTANDLLHSVAYLSDGGTTFVAFGPNLALKRQEDGTWTKPPEPERSRLYARAELGPTEGPPKCHHDAWFWLGRNLGWLSCKDRRVFIYDDGRFIARGSIPKSCHVVTRVGYAQDASYVVCAEHQIWRTAGQTWKLLPPPAGKDHDYFAVSVAGRCVFVTARRTVWRRCEP